MLRIRQRVDADISTVVGWIADADALNMFTGPRLVWPLTIDQLAAMTATDAISAWVMIDDRADVIGHFDLALDEGTARIGRGIVDPSRRGRGYGSALVRLAIEEARALGARALTLNVVADNAPAIATYERAGFQQLPMSDRPDVRTMALTL